MDHVAKPWRWPEPDGSEIDPVSAFQTEHLPRLIRGGDLRAEIFDDASNLLNLFGVGSRQVSPPDKERILKSNAHVAAHLGRCGGQGHLCCTRPQNAPAIPIAEEPVGGTLEKHEVVDLGTDSAEENAEETETVETEG